MNEPANQNSSILVYCYGVVLFVVFGGLSLMMPLWFLPPWQIGEIIQVVPTGQPRFHVSDAIEVPFIVGETNFILSISPTTEMVQPVVPEKGKTFWAVVGQWYWFRPTEPDLIAVANHEVPLRDWVAKQAALLR